VKQKREKHKAKPRMEMTHVDWITLYAIGAESRGNELLNLVKDRIGVSQNEKRYSGFGGGWYFEQLVDRGIRISANVDGDAKIELQGLFWTGAVADAFSEFIRMAEAVRPIKGARWKLTRVDVAIDIFGLRLSEAFPNPKSNLYEWNFAFDYSEHQTKTKDGEMRFTGYTIRQQRWSLTVYDKQIEITDAKPHPIKKSYFETLALKDEPITRVELRLKTAESLVAVQGALQTVCKESDFCGAILRHWGKYHRIKTKKGENEEARFHRLFREIEPVTFERVKNEKINRLVDDFKEIKIRDLARDFIRYGIGENKTPDDIIRIFQEQVEWLGENGEIPQVKPLPPSQKPEDDPPGRPQG